LEVNTTGGDDENEYNNANDKPKAQGRFSTNRKMDWWKTLCWRIDAVVINLLVGCEKE